MQQSGCAPQGYLHQDGDKCNISSSFSSTSRHGPQLWATLAVAVDECALPPTQDQGSLRTTRADAAPLRS